MTGHPLDKYREKLEDLHALSTAELAAMKSSTGKDENLCTAGIITNLRVLKSKKGDFYAQRSEEHTSELQSHLNLVCRLLLEKKKTHRHQRRTAGGDPSHHGDTSPTAATSHQPTPSWSDLATQG